jgi:ring-1,2-phenylacetyl-CoA epoxidase subunit PaaE
MSTEFHKVTVSDIEKNTADCSIITLDIPDTIRGHFNFIQGQYLTFKQDINGEDIRRSYSLCSSPIDNEWKVGIKKVPEGRFSTFANDRLKVGDTLEVMPPAGNFYVKVDPERKSNYVAFAAGSGITPMLSIIKTHLASEPHSTFKLFYINQKVSSIILKEELEALKNIHLDRFEIFHFLTRQQRGIPLFDGRLDEEKLEVIFKTLCDTNNIDHYFSCGPEAMIFLVKDFLVAKGVRTDKIHFELFGTSSDQADNKKKELKSKLQGKQCHLTITEGGKTMDFNMEQGADNILDAALNNDADLPFACKGGVCATCKAKLISGDVDMLLSYGLEQDEIDQGYILTCQALPTSEKVVVDFDI